METAMIDISSMFMMQIFLLCLIFIGIITVKTRMVDAHSRAALSELILNIFLPCSILASFFGTDRSKLPSLGIMMVISLGILALSFAISLPLYKRVDREQKKVLLYGTLISNATFLGLPIVESVYGAEGLPYAAVYLVPLRIALLTFGIAIFTGGKGNLRQVFLHPCLIATYLGILAMIFGFTPPALVSRLITSLGNCTTPVCMLVVGCILASVNPRKVVTALVMYFSFIRLVLIPLLVMGILLIFRPPPIVAGASVILAGMPAGATTSILADKYGADRELSSKIVFVSTFLSMITAPALAWLLQKAL
ncbi:MAG: AEC family transporter [Treponema sp.]|nr:AEC family transporter [Treponema sp.]